MKTTRPVIIGQFSPPALACVRSWGRKGMEVGLLHIIERSPIKPASRYLAGSMAVAAEDLWTKNGMEKVARFLREFGCTGLTCIDERIACRLQECRYLLPEGIDLWLPPVEVIKSVLSKERQVQVARDVGLDVLPTTVLRSADDFSEIPSGDFPLCLRPSQPDAVHPAFKVQLIRARPDLEAFLKSREITGSIIAQPFRNLPNLVVHGARTTKGKSLGIQAFLVERKFEGVTLTIFPYPLCADLSERCRQFTDVFGLSGSYHFEFLYEAATGKAWFLELNNRLGGTTAKVFACGYDEPLLLLCSYGLECFNNAAIREVPVTSHIAMLKYLKCSVTNTLTALDHPDESYWKRIRRSLCIIAKYKDDVFCFDDLRGSIALYFEALKNKLIRKAG